MLNKEVCKKCMEKRFGKWHALDDILWKKYKIVNCHKTRLGILIDVNVNTIDCEYVLEHFILNGGNNETSSKL